MKGPPNRFTSLYILYFHALLRVVCISKMHFSFVVNLFWNTLEQWQKGKLDEQRERFSNNIVCQHRMLRSKWLREPQLRKWMLKCTLYRQGLSSLLPSLLLQQNSHSHWDQIDMLLSQPSLFVARPPLLFENRFGMEAYLSRPLPFEQEKSD